MDNEKTDAAYEAALDYMYSFINFEQRPQDRYMTAKVDVSRPKRFLDLLGTPHNKFPSIHIAGTKGKGSVAALCATCLQAAGYKVGLYTSPHLQDFRERIRILTPDDRDGRIPKADFVNLIETVKPAVAEIPDVTWFEILTALGFLHFAQQDVDIAVVEVGLGGLFDSTNVITPLVSVITNISIDHTQYLGNTLAEIAYRKAGIIKPGVPVKTVAQKPEAMAQLLKIAKEQKASIQVVGQQWRYRAGAQPPNESKQELILTHSPDQQFISDQTTIELALAGDFQLENGTVALAALHAVHAAFPKLDLTAVRQGFAQVQWHGRLQIVHQAEDSPTILVDCAHNADSAQKLCDALTHHYQYENLWLVFGSARDKDIEKELEHLLPAVSGIVTTTVNHPRSATPDEIAEMATKLGATAYPIADMETAVATAWNLANPNDLICVTGSIYIVGDLLNRWESLQSQLIKTRRTEIEESRLAESVVHLQ